MLKIIFYLPKRLKIYENIPNTFKCQKFAKISMGRGTIKRQISKKLLTPSERGLKRILKSFPRKMPTGSSDARTGGTEAPSQ